MQDLYEFFSFWSFYQLTCLRRLERDLSRLMKYTILQINSRRIQWCIAKYRLPIQIGRYFNPKSPKFEVNYTAPYESELKSRSSLIKKEIKRSVQESKTSFLQKRSSSDGMLQNIRSPSKDEDILIFFIKNELRNIKCIKTCIHMYITFGL